jgi:hypothetical protein
LLELDELEELTELSELKELGLLLLEELSHGQSLQLEHES